MKRKICITGASKGIGLAEAKSLSKNNELFLHASSISSFRNSDINNAHYFRQDFSDINNVEKFVNQLESKTKTLDVLVNNIGKR